MINMTRTKIIVLVALVLLMLAVAASPAFANVTLVSFTASSTDGEAVVHVRWETATEINIAGFFADRSLSAAGSYTRTSPFIPAQGDSVTGATYYFTDTVVAIDTKYYYRLEAINNDQSVEYYGPISVIVGHSSQSACGVVSCTVYLPIVLKPPSPIPPQFEVTQAVQQPDNSVLLVANRPTYLRWTLTSAIADTNVTAYLYGSRNGTALPGSPLAALNNPRTLKSTADRAVLNDTFNFKLPDSWPSGDISLSANANNTTGLITYTTSQALHFNATNALQVKVVPIAYICNTGGTILPGDPPYSYLIDYTYRTYPVPSIDLSAHSALNYPGPCTSGLPDPANADWENMLYDITGLWSADGAPNVYYYGLLKVYCASGCITGFGWIGGSRAAVGFDGFGAAHSGASETHAHELGHNHGRKHAPGCNAPGPDLTFPYVPADGKARIGDAAHPNFGFDISTQAIYPYAGYYDVMNYCYPQWLSDYTYEALWAYDNPLHVNQPLRIGSRSILISGSIDPQSDQVTFRSASTLNVPARLPDRGDYTIELLDDRNRLTAVYSFAPVVAQIDRWRASSDERIIGFYLMLPYQDGITSVRVRHGGRILGARAFGP